MYAKLIVNSNISNTLGELTYFVPEKFREQIKIGCIVQVSLKNKLYSALVVDLEKENFDKYKIRDIEQIIYAESILSQEQINLAYYISKYYLCPIYKAISLFIPDKIFEQKYKEKIPKNKKQVPKENKKIERTEINLNSEQINALDEIINGKDKIYLLHGITGSGKTEIYLKLALEALKENKQTLILVPEISLTPQFINYFEHAFGEKIAVLHSKLSEGQKCKYWMQIKENKVNIIIGSRSSLFAPFQSLKYLIVDEEHSWTYKQDMSPRYNARDLSAEMTKFFPDIKVILGSATPSIESYYNSETKKFKLIKVEKRVNDLNMPKIDIVDLRNELRSGNFSIFSNLLLEKIKDRLDKKEQIILFLNRRGSSSSVVCRDCGYTCKCKYCDVSLTYHEKKSQFLALSSQLSSNFLQCHFCGKTYPSPLVCPSCQSHKIKFLGIGTQKIEAEINKLFPLARTIRADKDTTTKKDSYEQIFYAFKENNADILIGTQMISKGLDLPKVTLVGIVLADIGLDIPDFRATEKTFQTLTQVAGRAGRKSEGEVVIQTYNPENFAIMRAAKHDYMGFYENEIASRKALKYPPFSSFVKLSFSDKSMDLCVKESKKLFEEINNNVKTGLKPVSTIQTYLSPSYHFKLYNKYHYNIFLKGEKEAISELLSTLTLAKGWIIDIDPINL